LDILVVVSEQFVDVFVKIVLDCDYQPLWIHFEKQEEGENGFSTEYN